MNTQLPVANSNQVTFLNTLIQTLQRYFSLVVSQDEETPRIILRSPGGKLYDVTVTDAGVLTVTPTSKARA
jgi:hypothetical protein